jgi:hypothetical protein
MLFALSAASALLDGLQSLTSSQASSNSSTSAAQSGTPFDPLAGTQPSESAGMPAAPAGCPQISPQTLSALIDAQGQSGSTGGADASGSTGASGDTGGSGSDAMMQALDAATSSSVTNSDGSTTTTITYADGTKVSLTTPAASTTSSASSTSSTSNTATSSYNLVEQMIQREAKALSSSVSSSLSVSA